MSPLSTQEPPPGQVVLFDLYDTLIQPNLAHIEARRQALAKRAGVAIEPFREQLRHTLAGRSLGQLGSLGDELRQVLLACGRTDVPESELAELVDFEYATWRGGVRLFDDVLPTLRKLQAQGVKTAIVSNCSCQAGAVAYELGLEEEVDALVLSFQVGLMKPDPRMFQHALAQFAADPEHALLVDDVVENLDAARTMGMRTVLVSRYAQHAKPDARHPLVQTLAEVWPG